MIILIGTLGVQMTEYNQPKAKLLSFLRMTRRQRNLTSMAGVYLLLADAAFALIMTPFSYPQWFMWVYGLLIAISMTFFAIAVISSLLSRMDVK